MERLNVQLVCVNYGSFEDAYRVTEYSRKLLPFQRYGVAHPNPMDMGDMPVRQVESFNQNLCWIREIAKHIQCDHALSIHWDGYIARPELWDDSWLQYDWIGAPWRLENIPNPHWRVGSGGMFLFSKRMANLWGKICNHLEPFDWQVGALYRDKFEDAGMKFAPIEVAAKFCKECDLEDMDIPEGSSFGFHGFQYGNGYREKFRKLAYES